MILAKATWTEVDALDREKVVVIVPIGGTEQHGPSLPLGTSTILAKAVVQGIHDRLGDAVLVTPEIPFGASGADRSFAGTIDLGYEAFLATVRALVGSLADQSFGKFYFFAGGLTGTQEALRVALRSVKCERSWLQIGVQSLRGNTSMTMRGSLTLALNQESVRSEFSRRRPLQLEGVEKQLSISRSLVDNTRDLMPEGYPAVIIKGSGHPQAGESEPSYRSSSAEIGVQGLTWYVEDAVKLLQVMREGRVYVEPTVPTERLGREEKIGERSE